MELQAADFDLSDLIKWLSAMFRMQCQQKHLAWRIESLRRDSPRWVSGDPNKLRQVLVNLLANAVKFTDSGEVTLRVTPVSDDRLQSKTSTRTGDKGHSDSTNQHLEGSRFTFEVIDTGVGISPEAQEKIFHPFQQGEAGIRKGGTGLGLAITQKYIELMGGELELVSELGAGSRFFFTIPLPPATGDEISTSARRMKPIAHLAEGVAIRAVIADDNTESRDVLCQMLREIGAEALPAENGQRALEVVRDCPPDIVFMDIRMPQMDGFETARRIWEEFGHNCLKIVAISASVLEHERRSFLESGFDDFIAKPFRIERVCQCLIDLLGVEHTSVEVKGESPQPEISPSKISLPEDLFMRLKEAAADQNATQLSRCIDEVEVLGTNEQLLAEHLREFVQNLQTDKILDVLGAINHG